MDELDLLKKNWNKAQPEDKRLSSKDIYPMLHKKSSSIVKTLFYISVAELIFWILINMTPYLYSEEYRNKMDMIYSNEYLFTGITVLSYGIILLFIYLLFKSYKSISVTDNAKKLMESILKTRKIIKYYVLYNIIVAGISIVIGFYFAFTKDPKAHDTIQHLNDKQTIKLAIILVGITTVFVLVIWLFYKLIYGLLLKRLNKNYRELKQIEV